MLLFMGNESKLAIPLQRVYYISQTQNKISIVFDNGESPDAKTINFDNEEFASESMRNFYMACEKNKGAFYFG